MQRDSLANTLFVAISVCLVCSFLVSAAAVGLKTRQDRNVALDKKKNILLAAGFSKEEVGRGAKIEELFAEKVEVVVLDISSGETSDSSEQVKEDFMATVASEEYADFTEAVEKFDPIAAADKKDQSVDVENDIASLKTREKFTFIYFVKGSDGKVERYVFPIRGRGLWSTLKGFLAVDTDFNTVAGLTYYEHGETPGLGGEVDNPNWKKLWPGKKIFDDQEMVKLKVIKGQGTDEYSVDGLSGATITSRGVSNMVQYWFGDDGFKAFIEKQKAKQ